MARKTLLLLLLGAFAVLVSTGAAWLPSDGTTTITDRRGVDIFAHRHTTTNKRTAGRRHHHSRPRWLPPAPDKIRGVNLGGLFVLEPWMAADSLSRMGCGGASDEWSCVERLGQDGADAAFRAHWAEWIVEGDFDEMREYGINSVRIPLGYWMDEALVREGERYPRGGLAALLSVCGMAAERGIYVILDLHGAPGSQSRSQSFTGHATSDPQFYTPDNYARGVAFLAWLTELIVTKPEMRTVGMIGVLNEPLSWGDAEDSLRTQFYPDAYKAIRAAEDKLGANSSSSSGGGGSKRLHVQFMSSQWGSGPAAQYLPSGSASLAFEDHRYFKWDTSVPVSHDSYLKTSCTENRTPAGESPTVVTEWSLGPPDSVAENNGEWGVDAQKAFYRDWFVAQASGYERYTAGWVFWSWKTETGDWRWTYRDAVRAGVIPKDLGAALGNSSSVCKQFS